MRFALVVLVGCGTSAHVDRQGALTLSLDADHTDHATGQAFHAVWQLAANIDGDTGWVAITNRIDDGVPMTAHPTTHAVPVTVAHGGLAPFEITLPDLAGSVAFDTFALGGTATGTFHARSFDQIEDFALTGTVTVDDDTRAPDVLLASAAPPIALEPQTVLFDEPVDLAASSISLAATPIADPVSGLAIGVSVRPQGYWPDATAVTVALTGLRDAAGNAADRSVAWTSPARPDPSANLGFEAGLVGWLPRTGADAPFATQGVLAGTEHVVPPVGAAMADVPAEAQLVGFLVPPPGKTRLFLELALVNTQPVAPLQTAHRGLFVDIATPSGTKPVLTGGDLPLAGSGALWTGFHAMTIDLPADASGGFWLIVRGGALEPPINVPQVLFDDVHF